MLLYHVPSQCMVQHYIISLALCCIFSIVLNYIVPPCIALNSIESYCMILHILSLVLCCMMLHDVAWCCMVLHDIVLHSIPYIVMHVAVWYCITLYPFLLYYMMLYVILAHCIPLHCIPSWHIVLNCIAFITTQSRNSYIESKEELIEWMYGSWLINLQWWPSN